MTFGYFPLGLLVLSLLVPTVQTQPLLRYHRTIPLAPVLYPTGRQFSRYSDRFPIRFDILPRPSIQQVQPVPVPTPTPTYNWNPVDPPLTSWDTRPLLNPYDSTLDSYGTAGAADATEWAIVPVSWPNTIVQLSYCLVQSETHIVLQELIETAFNAWSQYLPSVDVGSGLTPRGLNLTYQGYCTDPETRPAADGESLTISLEKPSLATTGVTTRRFVEGGIQRPTLTLRDAHMKLDARLMPSAGLFYNTLLHEVGHLLGCDHPKRTPGSRARSVMGSSVTMRAGEILQESHYTSVSLGDIACIRELYMRDFPGVLLPTPDDLESIIPKYPASRHVSGRWDAAVPLSVPLTVADVSVLPLTAANGIGIFASYRSSMEESRDTAPASNAQRPAHSDPAPWQTGTLRGQSVATVRGRGLRAAYT